MIINLITLSTVKTQLGLATTENDTAITAMIPLVSNDVRRILNINYDVRYVAVFNDSAATINFGVTAARLPFTLGQVIYNPNIEEDTYLSAYNPDDGLYTITNTPTDTGSWVYPTIQISQWPAISKMIWYKTTINNTSSVNEEKLKSYSVGPISKTYADSEINKQWNYPQTLLDDLGIPYAEVG